MALYDTSLIPSQYRANKQFGSNGLLMNRYGKLTGFGSVTSAALPIIGRVGGSVLSAVTGIPGLGEVGGELGKLGVSAALSGAANSQAGFADSAEAAQESAAKGIGLAQIGDQVGSLAGGIAGNLTSPSSGKVKTKTTGNLVPTSAIPDATKTFSTNTTKLPSILPPIPGYSNAQTIDPSYNLFGSPKSKGSSLFTFADGGPVAPDSRQQQANLGASWVRNWIAGRAQARRGGLEPADAATAKWVVNPVVTTRQPLGEGANAAGVFRQSEGASGTPYVFPLAQNPTSIGAHEATHSWQYANGAMSGQKPLPMWEHSLNVILDAPQRPYQYPDDKPGSESWNTESYLRQPIEVHARLMQLRQQAGWKPNELIDPKKLDNALKVNQSYNQDLERVYERPTLLHLLNNTVMNNNNRLTSNGGFRAAKGGTTKPIRFAFGGVSGKIDAPTDYTLYPESDKKSEDILMHNPKTGWTGAMRTGEYIIPQIKTLAAEHIMGQNIPDSRKRTALGTMLFKQLKDVPVGLLTGSSYAGGGPTPKKPTNDPVADFKAYNQNIIDRYSSDLKKRSFGAGSTRDHNQKQKLVTAAINNLSAINSGQIKYDSKVNNLINSTTGQSIPLTSGKSPIPYSANGDNAYGRYGFETPTMLTSVHDVVVPDLTTPTISPTMADSYRTAKATGVIPSSTAIVEGINNPIPARGVLPNYYTPLANAAPTGNTVSQVPPTRTVSLGTGGGSRARQSTTPIIPAKTGITASQLGKLKQSASSFLPSPLGDPNIMADSPTITPAPITGDRVASALGVPVVAGTNYEPGSPAPIVPAKKFDFGKLATGIGDIARIGAGVALGSQHVDMPTIPARWLQYQGEVEARKNQGLSAEENALASNSIANNYRQGVNSLGLLTGGGSAPGTVLAGLTNLGLQRGQQTQNLLAQNALRRNQNFGQYGAVTGQTASLESGIQGELINRQAMRQGLGNQLVGSTLQNIENRNVFNQNAPLYADILGRQAAQSQYSQDIINGIKKKNSTALI